MASDLYRIRFDEHVGAGRFSSRLRWAARKVGFQFGEWKSQSRYAGSVDADQCNTLPSSELGKWVAADRAGAGWLQVL